MSMALSTGLYLTSHSQRGHEARAPRLTFSHNLVPPRGLFTSMGARSGRSHAEASGFPVRRTSSEVQARLEVA